MKDLLPVASSENSLAIVLGHEIAHAVAKHSAEQISKAQNQQVGTSILGSVLNQAVGKRSRAIWRVPWPDSTSPSVT